MKNLFTQKLGQLFTPSLHYKQNHPHTPKIIVYELLERKTFVLYFICAHNKISIQPKNDLKTKVCPIYMSQ